MSIHVLNLSTCPELYTVCASWAYEQWHKKNKTRYAVVKADYKHRAGTGLLPTTFVAMYGSRPIGMVSLKAYDLVTRRDLSPWLSALYVDVKFRNRGIGRLLVKTAIQTALNRGYPLLFLFTDRDNTDELVRFYSRLGWTYHDDARDIRSFQVKIMKYLLQSPPAAPMCND